MNVMKPLKMSLKPVWIVENKIFAPIVLGLCRKMATLIMGAMSAMIKKPKGKKKEN